MRECVGIRGGIRGGFWAAGCDYFGGVVPQGVRQ